MNEKRVSGKRSMNNRKGFTLVEAMIVICIMAVVAAIAIPQFQKMAINGNLKAAAKDVLSDFSSMRERAISENANFSIVFNIGSNNYTVPGLASPKTPTYFANDIRVDSTSFGSTITFQTRGTTSPPGDKTISLTNGRGSTATITIGTAGRIYVQYNLK